MRNTVLSGVAGLLIPFAAYGAAGSYGGYQRKLLSKTVNSSALHLNPLVSSQVKSPGAAEANDLLITQGLAVRELVVVDASVRDKHLILKQARPGVAVVEIKAGDDGVAALIHALAGYQNLDAVHVVAHAEAGAIYLGGHKVDQQTLIENVSAFAALNHAVREGGDLMLYGCDLAKGAEGENFLEILQQNTHVDIAASIDKTGNEAFGGNWELEIQTGDIEAQPLPESIALKDFSTVLAAPAGVKDFSSGWTDNGNTLSSTHFILGARDVNSTNSLNASIYAGLSNPVYIMNGESANSYFYVNADGVDTGTFELTALTSGEYLSGEFTDVYIVGILPDNSTITSSTINGTATTEESFNFGASELTNFSGVQIKGFKLYFDSTIGTGDVPNFEFRSFTTGAAQDPVDSDGTLSAAGGVTEPVGLDTNTDTVGEAVDVFDFTLTDGGTSDGQNMTVSQIVVNVSGTSTDAERSQITWRLNGPDASDVTGTYNAGADTITFSGLSISVADGGNETYTVNAYFNDNANVVEDHTIILNVNGDDDLTVGAGGTQMSGGNADVTNGAGTTVDVVATQLAFTTQPAGSVSGAALTTQPVVAARDAFGNTDVDFTETITLTEASAGSLSNNTQAATSGVATFTNVIYTATADQESFTLTANDQDGVGSDLTMVDANAVTSDVVATKLLFTTQPAPTTVNSGATTSFTTVPVVSTVDANDTVDTGYGTDITLAEVNGAGSATMSGTGDTDGSAATVSLTPSSGVATFTGMDITYTNIGADETFNLRASSGGLTTADSSQFASVTTPTVSDGNISISGASGTGGAYKIGDTVTATWNNTAGGDNNAGISGVTVDFSEFGGGAAVVATDSSDTWTATYTIVSGAIDGTNRNVSVTATNAGGDTTTADTTNATVDNVAPTVTDANINISGATGSGGAFKVGDTVTTTWNNTAGGDNNSDTMSSVTVDFTQFGGGAAVVASNSSDTWTATYTIVGGAIDGNNLNVSVTATDNAGNTTTTADSTNATVDGIAPTVSSVSVPANGSYIAGQNLDFTVNTNENVTVNTGGGTPRIELTVGATTRYADYLSGSGTSAVVFRYTVQAGDNDADGIAVAAAIDLNSGTLRDGAGNDLNTTLNSVGSTASVLVDTLAPALDSSVPADNATGVAHDADIVLNFSENVGAGAGSVAVYDAADDSLVENFSAASLGIAADVVTIDLSANLTPTHGYYVEVANNAFSDAAGNNYAGIADATTLNFTVANNAPVATDDSDTTNEDTAVAVDVLANDSDSDSNLNAASTAIVAVPANGSTSINTANGVITYTPDANFNGGDSFTYTVEDVFGAISNTATVNITVTAVNDAPMAMNDMVSTPEDNPIAIDVAANDTDVDAGDSVDDTTIAIASAASNGNAVVNAGQVTYTPNADYNGSDSFTYTIEDQNGAVSNAATVIVNITGVNDLPVAVDDSAGVDEDDAVAIDVVNNDTDVDGTIDATTVTIMSAASNGSTGVDAVSGAITYTPNANFNGNDSFTYVVQDDANGTSNAATVTITVNSINDAPAAADDTAVLLEDTAHEVNVLGNDSDVDGTLVPASVEVVSAPADGSTGINATTGAITYTPGADFFGNDSFTYRVQDNDGVWSTAATVTVTVNGVNDPPTAIDDTVSTNEDTAVVIDLLANDIDIDDGFDIASVVIVSGVSNGSLSNNSDGTVTYTPDINYNGSDGFTYEVDDVSGLTSNTATVTITVNAVNDVPTISGTPPASVSAGVAYSFTPTASDVENDSLSFSASNLPSWLSLSTTSGAITGTPGRTDEGVHGNIVLHVSDGVDISSLASFAIDVLHNAALDTDNDGIPDDVEIANGLDPDDFNDGSTDADGDGATNVDEYIAGSDIQADDYPPVFSALDTIEVNATGLLTRLPELDIPQAVDALDGAIEATLVTEQELFAPGEHTLTWAAVDAAGNRAETTQQVLVYPQISLGKDQIRAEGSVAMLRFWLNGVSPVYPLTVGYTLAGTADDNDHNLQAGTVVFMNGETEHTLLLNINADDVAEGTETLRVVLDAATTTDGAANFGVKRTHDLQIVEQNVAPAVDLSLQQNNQEARIVTQTDGLITFAASVDDPNPNDTHEYEWTFPSVAVTDVSDSVKTLDPANLTAGVYQVAVTVTDSNAVPLSTTDGMSFQVVAAAPVLDNTDDSDGDGIDDASEGFGDSDGDGQPDYLDSIPLPNVLNEQSGDNGLFLVEADPGIRLSLGEIALANGADGAHLSENDLAATPDSEFANVGGFFNITARDVPEAGASVNIVIPQRAVIPSNPRYRKLINGNWFNFIEDANNRLASAPGEEGLCPPPGSDDFSDGLTPGHWCVQLTIEDGGSNDADGEANGTVEDPGGVSQNLATATNARVKGGGGAIGWEALLLLALLLFRFRRVCLVAGALLIASQTHADEVGQWYLQAAIGQADVEWSESSFENRLDAIVQTGGITSFDDSRTTYDIVGGYQWKPWLGFEGGYMDWGEVDLQIDATTTDTAALEQLLHDEHPRSGKGLYAGVRFTHEVSFDKQPVTFFFKTGLWQWEGDYTVTVGGNRETFTQDGTDMVYGIGFNLPVYKQFETGLMLQQTSLDGDRQLQTAIHLLYRLR